MSPNTITVALVSGASQVIAARPTVYKGIIVREMSGGAAVLRVYDHASAASGTIIDIISLASGGVVDHAYEGITCQNGVFIERVSGTNVEGSVRLG